MSDPDPNVGRQSSQRKYATALASFVPETVKRYILQVVEHTGDLAVPQSQSFDTVALFADVSGFTALTDLLAKKGPLGAEEIGFYLNRYLEQLVKIISRSGGDVFKFAGDAIVVLWPPESDSASSNDLADMVHRAASCSLSIQSELHNAALEQYVTMSLKLGIGVGRVTVLHVGGVHGRIEYLPAGAPLMQAFRAEHCASPGEAIMSIEAWRLVETKFTGERINEHNVRLKGCKHAIRNISVRRTPLQWKGSLELLQMYVPAAVLPYLKINQKLWSAELRQVSIVFVNIGFKLEDFESAGENGGGSSLQHVQAVISSIQEATYRYEGSLNKFLVDDKGSTLLIVFGLPPLAHENDPTRAVLASLTISEAMKRLDLKVKIGVTSGLALCGLVGSGSRREYSVLGDLVNLSARLMQFSEKTVICDNATFLAARTQRRILFTSLPPIHVKGKIEDVIVHRAEMVKLIEGHQPPPPCAITVGRGHEVDSIAARIDKFIRGEPGFVSVISGEIGSGKTHTLRHIWHLYNKTVRMIWGRADPFSTAKSLQIFNSFALNLLSASRSFGDTGKGDRTPASIQAAVMKIIKDEARNDLIPVLSLLNPLLGTDFPITTQSKEMVSCDSPLSKNASGSFCIGIRSENVAQLLSMIIRSICSSQQLILVFDECQWIGGEAWRIVGKLCDMVDNHTLVGVSIIVATRPIDHEKYRLMFEPIPPEYLELRESSAVLNLVLSNLAKDDARLLIQSRLNGPAADPQLISLVFERTGGRPLFCVKFIEALLHVNALVMGPDSCHLSAEWLARGEWDTELPIPYRIQRITASHLDRVTPSQIMLLKVAATICIAQGEGALRFNLGMVRMTNPIHEYISSISADVKALIRFGILIEEEPSDYRPQSPDPSLESGFRNELIPMVSDDDNMNEDPIPYTKGDANADTKSYSFTYGFVRDFLYQIMLYKQRQKLHRVCSDYIQSHLSKSSDLEQDEMVLGRHVILSGAVPDQIDENNVMFGNPIRKSTIIPSQVSSRRSPRRKTSVASNDGSRHTPPESIAESIGPIQKRPWDTMKERFLCCFTDPDRKQKANTKLVKVAPDTSAASRSEGGDVVPRVLVSITESKNGTETLFKGRASVQPSISEGNRSSRSMASTDDERFDGYKQQRASIGILQELHRNPALGVSDRNQIAFVLNTMTSSLTVAGEFDLDRPISKSAQSDDGGGDKAASEVATMSEDHKDVHSGRDERLLATATEDDYSPYIAQARDMLAAGALGEVLSHMDRWDFDVFHVYDLTEHQPLFAIGYELFARYDLIQKFNIDAATLVNFLVGIEHGYNQANIPYHNSVHAADVTQTMHVLASQMDLKRHFTDFDLLAIVIACIIHDYRHPGQTNQFLVNTEDERALLFNDIRVLENFHCTAAFKFMRLERNNILRTVPAAVRQQLRQQIISLVLATSLVDHNQFLTGFNTTFEDPEARAIKNDAQRGQVLTMIIKCADISNACKPIELAREWATRIMQEFYNQGDVERSKSLPVSRFMDRTVPSMATCQSTFINMYVQPLFQSLSVICPGIDPTIASQLRINAEMWAACTPEQEKELLSTTRTPLTTHISANH